MATQNGSDQADDRGPSPAEKPAPSAKPPVVERLTHQDVNDICALYKRVWEAYRSDLPGELLKGWAPTPLEFTSWMEGVTYFAARREGKLVGAIGCRVSDGSCRLLHLAVDREHRRQGIATALTTAAIEWARHANSQSVWVDALARFTEAAAVLKHLGFAEAGILHRHSFGEDVRLLELIL